MLLWTVVPTHPQACTPRRPEWRSRPQFRSHIHSHPQPYPPAASLSGSVLDPVDELVDLVEDEHLLGELVADLLAGVHHRRVVATTEDLGDLRVAVIRELPEHVHADLPGVDERTPPALADQL